MASKAPSVLVFDVNETLLDVDALTPLFAKLFGDADAKASRRAWFDSLVLHSMALSLQGEAAYVPFPALGGAVLRTLLAARADAHMSPSMVDAAVAELGELTASLPPHADVSRAILESLRAAGFRLATLSNSPPPPHGTASALEIAGLAGCFEASLSVHAVRRAKPAPEVYAYAAEQLLGSDSSRDVSQLCLVACHPWDLFGAKAAGWRTALLVRPGCASLPGVGDPPDVEADGMADLAKKLSVKWR